MNDIYMVDLITFLASILTRYIKRVSLTTERETEKLCRSLSISQSHPMAAGNSGFRACCLSPYFALHKVADDRISAPQLQKPSKLT